MRIPLPLAVILLLPLHSFSEDDYAWLREGPVPKTLVVTSAAGKVIPKRAPKAAWKISSKDTRRRTMTISNHKPEATKKVQATPQPGPAELTLEQFNAILTAMEIELNKLNETPR